VDVGEEGEEVGGGGGGRKRGRGDDEGILRCLVCREQSNTTLI